MAQDNAEGAAARRLDRQYGWQRHLYDWTRPALLPGRDLLLLGVERAARSHETTRSGETPRVLEVGCGTGRNLRWLARRHPDWSLTGIELAAPMIAVASRRLRGWNVTIVRGDACSNSPDRPFRRVAPAEAVFFSYSLSMMQRPEVAVIHAGESLRPGGTLHLLDFADGEEWPAPLRAGFQRWLRAWNVRPGVLRGDWLEQVAPRLRVERATQLRRGYARLIVARRDDGRSARTR